MPSFRSAAVAAACVAALSATTGLAVAQQPANTIALGPGFRNTLPQVLIDSTGATHVTWYDQVTVPVPAYRLHYRRRTAGADTFEPDQVLGGFPAGQEFGAIVLREDKVNHRLLMFCSGSAPVVGLNAFVLTSTDGGATWSSPKRIWDWFMGTDYVVRPTDGAIAVTPGEIEVTRLIIPPSLPFQPRTSMLTPTTKLVTVTARGGHGIQQGFGPDGTSYTLFSNGAEGWVHIGSKTAANDLADAGMERDRLVRSDTPGMVIASGPKGTGILANPMFANGPLSYYPLSPAGVGAPVDVPLDPFNLSASFLQLVSDPEGNLLAVWRGLGQTAYSRRSTDGGATWGGLHTLSVGLGNGQLAYGSYAIGGPGGTRGAFAYLDGDSQVQLLQFDPLAVDPPPSSGGSGGSSTPSGGGGTTPSPAPSPQPTPTPTARLRALGVGSNIKLNVLRSSGLAVRINVSLATTARVRLLRGKKVLVTKNVTLRAGANTVKVKTRRATAGALRVEISVAGTIKTVKLTVR